MKIERIGIILCLIFVIVILPGCARRKETKQALQKPRVRMETSVDLPPKIREEKLSKIGISSIIGEKKDAEAELHEQTPSQPEVITEESQSPTGEQKTPTEIKAPTKEPEPDEPSIEFHFENADLEVLVNQVAELFDVTFVADDSITPMLQGAKSIKQNKISFKTQRPLTKKEAWDLFLTFLEISGFTVISEASPKLKRIVTIEVARKSPLPAYIGTSHQTLPNSDEMIRYVYFIQNAAMDTIKTIVDQLRSTSSAAVFLQGINGFVLTDKSYNIKSLMNIITELDKVTMPQAMSVLKLRRADAEEVEKLYKSLAGTSEKDIAQQRFLLGRKPSSSYFPDNVGIFAEKRTNSLVLLGPADAIKRIEDFITQSVDVDLTQPYSPLQVIQLRYADAKTIADIMNQVTQFGNNTEAGKSGGVRGGDKYLKPMTFTAEPEANRIVIKGDYEDFLKAKEVITQLDAPQPQVAIEVLLVSVALNDIRQLGTQMRSREFGSEGLMGNAKFQTSGLFGSAGIVENQNGAGVNRLLGNLLNLVSSGVAAGNTIVSLGDSLSTWAIIQAFQTLSNVQVLANPFLIATNKTKATVSLGEIRRLITATIVGTQNENAFGDAPAALTVVITPQINSDGMIVMDIDVLLSQFVGVANPDAAVRTNRQIKTHTTVSNKEVIALGGLVQNNITEFTSKVPILGDIPILGWLFKNKQKITAKNNLLILISARILEPDAPEAAVAFTNDHITDYTDTLNEMNPPAQQRDPINRWFFANKNINESATDEFIFKQQKEGLAETNLHKDIVVPSRLAKNTQSQPPESKRTRSTSGKATVVAQQSRRSKKGEARA